MAPAVVHYGHADLRILLQPVRNRLRGARSQRHEAGVPEVSLGRRLQLAVHVRRTFVVVKSRRQGSYQELLLLRQLLLWHLPLTTTSPRSPPSAWRSRRAPSASCTPPAQRLCPEKATPPATSCSSARRRGTTRTSSCLLY